MRRWPFLLAAIDVMCVQAQDNPAELLARIRERMRESLERQPSYTCLQTVERQRRKSAAAPFETHDTLKLEVGLADGREIFSWRGARRFEERELADMVGSGTIGNGNFALHARNVFLSGGPKFTYPGVDEMDGRPAHRFDFDVPLESSSFRIRVPPNAERVAFYGSFWADVATLDVIRLEVHVDEMPDKLGLARASDIMEYARTRIGDSEHLLPKGSELTMVSLTGDENRNRTQFAACRQYVGESTLSFDAEPSTAPKTPKTLELPSRVAAEVMLDTEIDPERASIGDPIRAVLTRPMKDVERLLAPKGAVLTGRLVRIDKEALPFPHYVVGLEFHTLELEGVQADFSATMEEAGPARGLIVMTRRMDPVFTKRRSARMDILVREQPRGQGVLHWRASETPIRRGLRMRWVTTPEAKTR